MRYVKGIKENVIEVVDTNTWTSAFYTEEEAINTTKEKYIHGIKDGTISVFDMNEYAEIVMARDKMFGVRSIYDVDILHGRLRLRYFKLEKEGMYIVADGVYTIGDGEFSIDKCRHPFELRLPQSCRHIECLCLAHGAIRGGNFNSVISIDERAFMKCNNIRVLNFGSAVEVEEFAFEGCERLELISLPKAERIDNFAFRGCHSLREANVSGLSTTWLEEEEPCGIFSECPNLKRLIVSDEVARNIKKYQEYLGCGLESLSVQ